MPVGMARALMNSICLSFSTILGSRNRSCDSNRVGLTIDREIDGHEHDAWVTARGAAGRLSASSITVFGRFTHFALATSAALIPSWASPYPTPTSMILRSF